MHPLEDQGRRSSISIVLTISKIVITIGLLVLLLSFFSPVETLLKLKDEIFYISILGVLAIFVALLCGAWRWILVTSLLGKPLPFKLALRLTFVGHFFNQILPTSVGGDAVRIWGVKRNGIELSKAISGVVFDRLIGLAGLSFLIIVSLIQLSARLSNKSLALLAVLIFCAGLSCYAFALCIRVIPARYRYRRVWGALETLSDGAWALLGAPISTFLTIGLSICGHLSAMYLTAIVARALGSPISFVDLMMIVPTILVLSNLPISIAGWGVREASMVGGFVMLGHSGEIAVASSLVIGCLNLVSAVPGGLMFINYSR